jgi:hypothetical protein
MSDIEKYGLFAVLFVGGILLLVAVSGGFSADAPPAVAAAGTPSCSTSRRSCIRPTARRAASTACA